MMSTPNVPNPLTPTLAFSNSGMLPKAKIHLNHTLQVVHKCPVNLPYSTINAILNGRLTWADQTNPEAFSVFSCFKPGPSTTDTSSDDFLALQLKSAEGKGLSDADVARSTKVIHRIPHDEHQLGEFIASFALVLSIIFSPKSSICEAVSSWVTHICDNENAQQMRADRYTFFRSLDRAIFLINEVAAKPEFSRPPCELIFKKKLFIGFWY
jgi:hypothetical protein